MDGLLEALVRRRVDVVGVLVFLAVVAVLVAAVALPTPAPGVARRPLRLWQVPSGGSTAFTLPPDAQEVKLVVLGDPEPGRPDPARDLAILLDVAFRGADGVVVGEHEVHLRAGPAFGAWGVTSDHLAPRTTRVPVPSGAVQLDVGVPDGHRGVSVRAFHARSLPLDAPELALLRLDAADVETLARQLGLASWHDVTAAEAEALVRTRWKTLNPVRGPEGSAATVVRLPDPVLPADLRGGHGRDLDPGRALAWPVEGPAEIVAIGRGDLEGMAWWAVLEDVGRVELAATPVAPPAWRPGAQAVQLSLSTAGTGSLHGHALGGAVEGLQILVDDASWRGSDPAVPLAALGLPDTRAVLLPAHRRFRRVAVRPGVPAVLTLPPSPVPATVRLGMRAVKDGATPPALEVRVRRGDEVTPLDVPFEPSAYERAGPAGAPIAWDHTVGERVDRFLRDVPGGTTLEVEVGSGIVLLEAAVEGPVQGDAAARDARGITAVRYAPDLRSWWTRLPWERGEPWDLEVVQRREPVDPSEREDRDRRYVVVPPLSPRGDPSAPWFVPWAAEDGVPETPWWCAVPEGGTAAFTWDGARADRLGGLLHAVLWAPGRRALGAPFSVDLDGRAWWAGRVVSSHTTARRQAPASETVSVEGPRGSMAWLRTDGRGARGCQAAGTLWRALEVPKGTTARWRLTKPTADRLLVVTGLSDGPTPLAVRLVPRRAGDDVTDERTVRTRALDVAIDPSRGEAWSRDRPGTRLPVLDGGGMMLRSDLSGPIEVEIVPMERDVWIRLLLEDPTGRREASWAPRRVSP